MLPHSGGVKDTKLEAKAKDTKKSEAKVTKKSETQAKDSLFEDRPSRGQGQVCSRPRPRTKDTAASVLKKKRSSKIFFRQSPIYRRGQNFWLIGRPKPQITCNGIIKNFQKRKFLWDKDIIGWKI